MKRAETKLSSGLRNDSVCIFVQIYFLCENRVNVGHHSTSNDVFTHNTFICLNVHP